MEHFNSQTFKGFIRKSNQTTSGESEMKIKRSFLLKKIHKGEVIPKLYGVYYYDYERMIVVCLPMPFNVVFKFFRNILNRIRQGLKPDLHTRLLRNNFNSGYYQGHKNGYDSGYKAGYAKAWKLKSAEIWQKCIDQLDYSIRQRNKSNG